MEFSCRWDRRSRRHVPVGAKILGKDSCDEIVEIEPAVADGHAAL
jgi:hypothetical protein